MEGIADFLGQAMQREMGVEDRRLVVEFRTERPLRARSLCVAGRPTTRAPDGLQCLCQVFCRHQRLKPMVILRSRSACSASLVWLCSAMRTSAWPGETPPAGAESRPARRSQKCPRPAGQSSLTGSLRGRSRARSASDRILAPRPAGSGLPPSAPRPGRACTNNSVPSLFDGTHLPRQRWLSHEGRAEAGRNSALCQRQKNLICLKSTGSSLIPYRY